MTKITGAERKKVNPLLKLVLEMGPLVLFFLANQRPALFRPLLLPVLGSACSRANRPDSSPRPPFSCWRCWLRSC